MTKEEIAAIVMCSLCDRIQFDLNEGPEEMMMDKIVEISVQMAEKLKGELSENW